MGRHTSNHGQAVLALRRELARRSGGPPRRTSRGGGAGGEAPDAARALFFQGLSDLDYGDSAAAAQRFSEAQLVTPSAEVELASCWANRESLRSPYERRLAEDRLVASVQRLARTGHDSGFYHYVLGCLYAEGSDRARAERHLRSAVARLPEFQDAARRLRRLVPHQASGS